MIDSHSYGALKSKRYLLASDGVSSPWAGGRGLLADLDCRCVNGGWLLARSPARLSSFMLRGEQLLEKSTGGTVRKEREGSPKRE